VPQRVGLEELEHSIICGNRLFFSTCTLLISQVMLSDAAHNIDANGSLTNEQTRELIRQLFEALVAWTNQLKCNPQ